MTPTIATDFRPVPNFANYEVNPHGTVRRRIRGSRKYTAKLGKPIGRHNGTLTLEQDGRTLGTTHRALVAKVFGPDAVEPWRYHIVLNPALKIHKGETNGRHVMTAERVTDLRGMYASGDWTHRELAAEFSIARSTVAQILGNKTWKHLEQSQ
jgi:hypothetical protein